MQLQELNLKPYQPRPVEESILYKMGYEQAVEDFAQALKDYVYNEHLIGNEPYWTVAIKNVVYQLKER